MEDWGECFTDQKEIYLSTNCLENPEVHWWTLVHEVTHHDIRNVWGRFYGTK